MKPKYPKIHVELSGHDGNAYAIIGAVSKAMSKAGVDSAEIHQFSSEAMSGDYDNVIQAAMKWVEVT